LTVLKAADCPQEINLVNQLFPAGSIVVNEGQDLSIQKTDIIQSDGGCRVDNDDVRFYFDNHNLVSTSYLVRGGESCVDNVDASRKDFHWKSSGGGCT